MPDEDKREGLRIGGWIPPYRDTNGPLRAPVPPRGARQASWMDYSWMSTARRRADRGSWAGRRAVLAAATGAVIAVIGLTTLALRDDDGTTSLAQRVVAPPVYEPSAPVSVEPSPTTSSPGSMTRSPSHAPPSSRPARKPPVTTRPTTAPPVTLVPGATVSLGLADRPGYRLRHRDFVARFDDFGPGNSRLDRQDSQFTVRAGLGADRCASFESVNFPGYFLRHRDFVLRLDRRDRSQLFDRDATFCPVPVRQGAALILESINYPDRFLVARDRGVHLDRVDPTQATALLPLT